ncbi:hypothetical protein CAEBREN_25961 [Caenorhabditis brenneri]|uniref:Uncharacterized protein n=1 Tax=Caenorhabditis brenneri TaxID=135651 RepID=G0M7Y0_CAEBE|nr:hypothetical protein CAEBREN_25961 [Caenorhabditis brenneri]
MAIYVYLERKHKKEENDGYLIYASVRIFQNDMNEKKEHRLAERVMQKWNYM